MSARWTRWPRLSLPLLVAALCLSCAAERDPINRVQPAALEKAFFVGRLNDPGDDPEFYWRNFVVDGSEAQSLIGIGSWSAVDRIRWEIQENLLVARKAYPISPGADDKGDPGEPDGVVVAAYEIESHFDIRRAYNPQTGEELNVIEENSDDRPWYEREYMRVDWSMNLVDTPDWFDMFLGKLAGDVKVTPIAYYVTEPAHPDAPHFDASGGYFDITSKFLVEPEQMESPFSDIQGKIPACILSGFYVGNAIDNCDPQEAVVRSSYLKVASVDPDDDFEPFENNRASLDIVGNPGGLGDAFSVGIVTPPRITWDPQYGYTDAGLLRLMHLHNIWQKSHQTRGQCTESRDCEGFSSGARCLPSGSCTVPCDHAARRDSNQNGTDDQCENGDTDYQGSEGSQCSLKNRCTIPYRDRDTRPVGYWMNAETPEGLTDSVDGGRVTERGPTEDIVYTWNQAMQNAVANAREVECRITGGSRGECHNDYFEPGEIEMVGFGGWGIPKVREMPDILVPCHNPVRSYDAALCGSKGYSARVGDLRHNFLFYWPYASHAPWGGIGNWSADPLTGQIIGASATTMGRSATMAAAMYRDIIMVANGELDMEDITGGTPASLYQKRLREGRAPVALDLDQIEARVNAIDATSVMQALGTSIPGQNVPEKMQTLLTQNLEAVSATGPASPIQQEFEALARPVADSPLAAQLVGPTWSVDLLGASPGALDDAAARALSPIGGADPTKLNEYFRSLDLKYQARGVCFLERELANNIGSPDVQGLARHFLEKYSDGRLLAEDPALGGDQQSLSRRRAERIYDDLWVESFKGIQFHEMGHSLGLLHEFASSYDSPNYNPQYWQLRTDEGRATASCEGAPRTGASDTCMGPRYLDPETDDELGFGNESRPGINYFANTSTMEYQSERFFENAGMGQYDLFAIGALYGRVLETFDPEVVPLNEQQQFGVRNWSQITDDNLVNYPSPLELAGTQGQTFVQPMHYTEQARRMRVFDPSRCRDATPDEIEHAEWRIVHGLVCAAPPKDHARWEDFETSSATGQGDSFVSLAWRVRPDAGTAPGAVRWPYRWGTTNNAYVHTNPFDSGADLYELTQETLEKFDYTYPFSYFRRQRRDYFYPSLPSFTFYRFLERLRSYHWSVASSNANYRSFGEDAFNAIARSDDWWRPALLAETDMFNGLAKALLTPQAGSYSTVITPIDSTRTLRDSDDGEGAPLALGNPFTIDAATGRFIDPDYDSSPGGGGSWEYLNWIHRAGYALEKSLAAEALTDGRPTLSTISRETYLDGRNIYINFRSDMPQAVDRLLGGVLSGDWETVAPYVQSATGSPEVSYLDLTTPADVEPTRPSASILLFPNLGYRQQLGTTLFTHLFSRLGTDLALANKLRIWVEGLTGEISVPEDEQIRFLNPESGYTYVARRYGPEPIDGKLVDRGIGSRMLAHANALLAGTSSSTLGAYEVERDDDGAPILDEAGQPTLLTDDDGEPIVASSERLSELRRYIGLLDASVQIQTMVGYGPYFGLPGSGDLE